MEARDEAHNQAIADMQQGKLITCSENEYQTAIRGMLHAYAARMLDHGQDVYAIIALEEVKRLDKKFHFDIAQ